MLFKNPKAAISRVAHFPDDRYILAREDDGVVGLWMLLLLYVAVVAEAFVGGISWSCTVRVVLGGAGADDSSVSTFILPL